MKKTKLKKNNTINFDLKQLEIFCRVVELNSFSKAADAVFLAQASVSERIAVLEQMTGTKLIDRLGRQISPTTAGKLLYKHAKRLLQMKKTACMEMEDFLGIKKGEILMGASTIPGEYILPKAMGEFTGQYPLISISIIIADTKKIEDFVLQGEVEAGIVGDKSNNKNIIKQKLWNDELILAVPADHKWASKKKISIRELAGEPFIIRESGSGTLNIIEYYIKAAKLKDLEPLRIKARLGSSTAVKEGIKAGLGVSILSKFAVETEMKAGILKKIAIKELDFQRKFYLITDKRRDVSPLCKNMINFLLNY